MHKFYLGLLVSLFILGLTACSKYDPIFGVAGNKDQQTLTLKKNLVYIHDNDIYLLNEILSDERKLTNSSINVKTHVALSPKHDQIAYLNLSGQPVIIDTLGNTITTLSQYTGVKDLKWHANNGNPTLYFLHNNEIKFHGPTMNITSTPFDFAFPSNNNYSEVDAIHIDNSLNVIFSYRYQAPYSPTSPWQKYYYGVAINYNSAGSTDKKSEIYENYYMPGTNYNNLNYKYYYSVSHNESTQSVILGAVTNNGENNANNYSLWSFLHIGTNTVTTQSTSLTAENGYQEGTKGHVIVNPYQLRKYLVNLPAGVPPPTGTANTYTINFPNQNNSVRTYFDWQP